MYLVRLMLVGVWLGLLWVLFYFFDHYIQSSVQLLCFLDPLRSVLVVYLPAFSSVQFSVQFSLVHWFWFDILVTATLGARGYLVWTSLVLFSFFDHYIQSPAVRQICAALASL